MDLSGVAIRQPVTVTVGVILIVLAGFLAYRAIPVQLTPDVEQTIIQVDTHWEGASPQEIEQDVIDRQEEKLQGIAGLKSITSTSQQSLGQVRLEFSIGMSKEQALREVSDKLREVPDYPDNVDEPVISASDPETRDYIAWIVFRCSDPEFDVRTLADFAEDRIEAKIERVIGIAEANVLGGREREVQIRFDPVRLAERGITLTDMVAAIRQTNRNVSAGRLRDGRADVRVRTVGQYTAVGEVEETVLTRTAAGPVHLRDVATVVETFKEPDSFVRHLGEPVIAINTDKEVGANVMEVMRGLKEAIAELNAPGGVLDTEARRLGLKGELRLEQVYDQTTYIDDALALVKSNILYGGGLAILVLILFLRSILTAGMIAIAIPISVIGAFAVMVGAGRSINVVSLAGMAFAVGMVVDNAIVVLENIYRHLEMGKKPFRAAHDAAREVWGAVLASTLTTIVVFVPILMVQEEAGQLFRDIALAICAAVGLSLVVSITVIPAAAARLLGPGPVSRFFDIISWPFAFVLRPVGWLLKPFGKIPDLVAGTVYLLCGSVIARVAVVLVLTAASLVGSYMLKPPADYLPTGNRNIVFGMMFAPPGYSLDYRSKLGERVEETIRPFWEAAHLEPGSPDRVRAEAELPEVPTFDFMRGVPGPPTVPPPIKNYFLVSFQNMFIHGAIADDSRRVSDLVSLMQYASRATVIPGVIGVAFQLPLFRLGGNTGSAVKINMVGSDLDLVTQAAASFYMKLAGRYGFRGVQPDPSNFNIPGPEVQVIPDRIRLAEAGLTPADLGLAVQASGDGAIIGEYRIGGQNIDLKVIAADAVGQEQMTAFADLPVATRAGRVVPLGSLAEPRAVSTPQQINRVGRLRSVTLQFTPPAGLALEEAIAQIQAMIAEGRASGEISPLVETSYTGSASKLREVQTALLGDGDLLSIATATSSLVLALLVTYLLMCVLFQSFVRPLVIIFSVPLATLGGFAALFYVYITSVQDPYTPIQMLDVLTMLGFVILIGIVVNNAILIVHQAVNFMRGEAATSAGKREVLEPREAIAEAVRTRVRPIFMSTLTSVGGMLPLVVMPGSGSELYRGLGSVVVGGLVVSMFFTLLLVPLLLSLVTSAQQRLGLFGRKRRNDAALAAAGIGKVSMVLLAVALLGVLPGCGVFRAERDPQSLDKLLADIVLRDVAMPAAEGERWTPPSATATLDKALRQRLPELEKTGGPQSFDGDAASLGVDLNGQPQKTAPLSLKQAVTSAVKHNLGVQVARFDPEIAARDMVRADAAFDSVLFADVGYERLDQPARVPVIGGVPLGVDRLESDRGMAGGGVRKKFLTGGTLALQTLLEHTNSRTSGFAFDPDPSWRTGVGITLSQPLLQGMGAEVNRSNLDLAENERERTVLQLKREMLDVIAETEGRYWDLVTAKRTLLIQQRLLGQGKQVKDVLEARQTFDARQAEFSDALATVQRREGNIVDARRMLKYASDRLKVLLNDPQLPLANEDLVDPTEHVDISLQRLDLAEAVRTAVRERPEVRAAVLEIDDARVRERVAKNLVLPKLDLTASVFRNALEGEAGNAYDSLHSDNFADYGVGLSFELPIGNRSARADRERAAFVRNRSVIKCQRVINEVVFEVKTALRAVQTSYELLTSVRATRIAETENLRALLAEEAENRKLTPEFLNLKFQRQERLALAQENEMRAMAAYRKALALYYRAVGTGLAVKRVQFHVGAAPETRR